ncbi:MAG: hypothetical protein EOP48_07985 [Sphingobacteriales bacterium]|nr:MAG: hypothetical protein EOP48_07985 [Sphingobacteriales bacterium]
MKSKFTFSIIGPVVLFLSSSFILAILLFLIVKNPELDPSILVAILLSLIIWIWIVFGEFRKKLLAITIQHRGIQVVSFLGLGNKKMYLMKEFDGFYTISMPSRYKTYEYLFLIKNGKRVVTVSEFYHANYLELKAEIKKNSRNLGVQDFNWSREFRKII